MNRWFSELELLTVAVAAFGIGVFLGVYAG